MSKVIDMRMGKKSTGFTLMEIMIVVVIIGIITAFAYPAYTDQVQRARRADAQSALLQAAASQEKWYFTNSQYTNDIDDLIAPTGGANLSPEGYYNITLTDNNGAGICTTAALNCFLLTASPVAGTSQASDGACSGLSVDQSGKKTNGGTGSVDDCW